MRVFNRSLSFTYIRLQLNAMQQHFHEQFRLYGPQILVNLLNRTGREKAVKDAFEHYIVQLPQEKINYTHFDFHKECKHMRWHRIDMVMDQLQHSLNQQGFEYYFARFPMLIALQILSRRRIWKSSNVLSDRQCQNKLP